MTDYETTGSDSTLNASYLRGTDGLISQTTYDDLMQPTGTYYHYNPTETPPPLPAAMAKLTRSDRYDAFESAVGKTAYVSDPLTGQTIPSAVTPEELTYGYTGKWQRDKDLATGTVRMGVREYDPSLGRSTSLDPLKGSPGNPQSRNWYAYALNNPGKYYDLDGLTPDVDFDYYEIDKTEQWWNDVAQEGLEDDNAVTGFFKWAGGKTMATVLDMGPEAAQNFGRAWGDPCSSNWDRFSATAELVLDTSLLLAPELAEMRGAASGLRATSEAAKGIKSAEGAGQLVKGGLQISEHAEQRMAGYGVSRAMAKKAIQKGTPYWDPKNGTTQYILKNGFASGDDLLIARNPITGKITTVIKDVNQMKARFIP